MTIHEEIKASEYILYQDDHLLVVQDHDPISKGHALIIPQEPYMDIDDLPPIILKKIFRTAQLYIKLMKAKFEIKGYSIMQNGGDFNDIAVFHLHVFPRFNSDEFGYKRIKPIEKSDVIELKEILQEEINNFN